MLNQEINQKWLKELGFLALTFLLMGCAGNQREPRTGVRVGWLSSKPLDGQIVQALKHAGILDSYPLSVEYSAFANSDSLDHAALAGSLDLLLTDMQSTVSLFTTDRNWTIVGRLAYDRVAICLPPQSPIHSVADLEGKTLGSHSGSAAHRFVQEIIRKADLKKVKVIDLTTEDQLKLVEDGSQSEWGIVDALACTDPMLAELEAAGKARVLQVGKEASLILLSNDFVKEHSDAIPDLLMAFLDANLYFARHADSTGHWFNVETGQNLSPKALRLCASIEPNHRAWMKGHINMNLSEPDLAALQSAAVFALERGLITKPVDLRPFVNLSYLRQAETLWWTQPDKELVGK